MILETYGRSQSMDALPDLIELQKSQRQAAIDGSKSSEPWLFTKTEISNVWIIGICMGFMFGMLVGIIVGINLGFSR
jgi:hypothetical protein